MPDEQAEEIDRDVFMLCVQRFADARSVGELNRLGEQLRDDKLVGEATKVALREEFRRNLKRLRAEKHGKKIADDGGDF